MTKIEALVKTIEVWTYLSENPWATKQQAYQDLNLTTDSHECPCCQYGKEQNKYFICQSCPIWPAEKEEDAFECENNPESPYFAWQDHFLSYPEKRNTALRMVALAQEALKEENS
jgi:hypothetical protein